MNTDTLFVERAEKSLDVEPFKRSVFVQDLKRKRNLMKNTHVVRIAENLRAKRHNFSKVLGAGNQVSQLIYLTNTG